MAMSYPCSSNNIHCGFHWCTIVNNCPYWRIPFVSTSVHYNYGIIFTRFFRCINFHYLLLWIINFVVAAVEASFTIVVVVRASCWGWFWGQKCFTTGGWTTVFGSSTTIFQCNSVRGHRHSLEGWDWTIILVLEFDTEK